MGALVLILVIVVSQASATAKATLKAEELALQETSDLVEVAQEELKLRREKQQEAINDRRSQLAAIEDHITRLTDELRSLQEKAELIEERSLKTETERAEQDHQIATLTDKLVKEQARLEQARASAKTSHQPLPSFPNQGDTRYLAAADLLGMHDRGVVIQPEGVLISIEDLKPPHGPGNPLTPACD